jgi:hypothetical protein
MAICVHGCSALSRLKNRSVLVKTASSDWFHRFFGKSIGEFEYFWNFEIKNSKKTRGDFKILVKTEFKKLS